MGEMAWEVWKWLDTGEVEFRVFLPDGYIENILASSDPRAAGISAAVTLCESLLRIDGVVGVNLSGGPQGGEEASYARALAEAWPDDVSRETLIARAFRARDADESHRARLRVEIGRLRKTLRPLAGLDATKRGFVLKPHGTNRVVALAPPVEGDHAEVLALLADGEAWSSSALALALDVSPRTAQRALEALAEDGKIESFGRGRACRWMVSNVPGFPTSLLLLAPLTSG